ncbi:flagellar brake protein [Paenibacillus turpanensis]|uniref:flagellar brake protein n=1 Tax=Paenibacillus turpanensis TaxID=2689078 RepID=UPI001408F04E|nr:flagellar brake domain-containing protein [Paenibacillus turpanensis]
MLPKINSLLFLQIASYDEEEAKQEYKSRIADVDSEYFYIEVPIHEKTGRMKRLVRGDQISAYYMLDGGVKHYFQTDVIGMKEDAIKLFIIRKPDPESITKIQRRSYLRVPANLEIALNLKEHLQFIGVTEDVGGGGVSFVCEGHLPIKEGDKLSSWLLIPFKSGAIDHANFGLEVVRSKKLDNGKQLVMCRYGEISETERQRIVKFCFERQIDIRKN